MTHSHELAIICEYSARKNSANGIAEYSTLYPETSSDSPSDRSNGALLVSANSVTRNINAKGHIKYMFENV